MRPARFEERGREDEIRVERECPRDQGLRILVIACVDQEGAEVDEDQRVVGREGEGPAEGRFGGRVVEQTVLGYSIVEPDAGVDVRHAADVALEQAGRLFVLALAAEHMDQIADGLPVPGMDT